MHPLAKLVVGYALFWAGTVFVSALAGDYLNTLSEIEKNRRAEQRNKMEKARQAIFDHEFANIVRNY